MIDLVGRVRRHLGRTDDSASATGSLQARLAELLARITTTIVGRIDVAVSSRIAAASYTSARAAKLDGADYKSLQYVVVTIASGAASGTATISSVTTSKAAASFLGKSGGNDGASGDTARTQPRIDLTNSTTVTATRQGTNGGAVDVGVLVEEWN